MRDCASTLGAEMTQEELDLLQTVLSKSKAQRPHVEIGTAAGGTLWRMINFFGRKDHPLFVVVDPMGYFPNQLEVVKTNLIQHGVDLEKVEFRQMTSKAALIQAKQADERFSFILIDGRHKIRYVMEDLMWGELLEEGGLLCLHDYVDRFPGVIKSANWFIKNNPHYSIEKRVGSLFVLRKETVVQTTEVGLRGRLYALSWSPYLQLKPSVLKRINRLLNMLSVFRSGNDKT